MWVRSQGKTKLLKVECVEYCSKKEQITEEMKDKKGKPIYIAGRPAKGIVKETTYHCIYVNGVQCSKYSTEEKALKVLDMIQERMSMIRYTDLVLKPFFTSYNDTQANKQFEYYVKQNKYVFQMPQDEEVEV